MIATPLVGSTIDDTASSTSGEWIFDVYENDTSTTYPIIFEKELEKPTIEKRPCCLCILFFIFIIICYFHTVDLFSVVLLARPPPVRLFS